MINDNYPGKKVGLTSLRLAPVQVSHEFSLIAVLLGPFQTNRPESFGELFLNCFVVVLHRIHHMLFTQNLMNGSFVSTL